MRTTSTAIAAGLCTCLVPLCCFGTSQAFGGVPVLLVPGPPTFVTLDVSSSTDLRVQFSGPSNNGGDAVTSYNIEYTEFADPEFANARTVTVTFLGGGAPFFKTIGGLVTGTKYCVRVKAARQPTLTATVRRRPRRPAA